MRGGVRKRWKRWVLLFLKTSMNDGSRKKVEKVGGDTRPEAEAA